VKRILILGVNGFIGHHLSSASSTGPTGRLWHGYAERPHRGAPRSRAFPLFEGDITINHEWIEYHVRKCDTVLPLVAIATPAIYVKEPLKVFELDFEAICRSCGGCVRRQAPGFSLDLRGLRNVPRPRVRPGGFPARVRPDHKPRWIYACAKQLMDRVIHAYGMKEGLDYTLFVPLTGSVRDWTISTPPRKAARG